MVTTTRCVRCREYAPVERQCMVCCRFPFDNFCMSQNAKVRASGLPDVCIDCARAPKSALIAHAKVLGLFFSPGA